MEFWGVEVKCGEPLLVEPGEGMVLHLSQANLGEAKKDKGGESICIHVTVDGKKLVLATLNTDKLLQQQFDLVFDRDFEISHNWKNGSVFFYGYLATNPVDEDEDSDEFESDEDIPLHTSNGKPDTKSKPEKPAVAEKANTAKDSASGKPKVKVPAPKKGAKDEDDDESSDEDEDMDDEEDSETGEGEDGSDSEDSEDESEETPKKVESGKKRPSESSKKTPLPEKKVKMATPQKTDGKKGGSEHVATPHPSKKAGKTPGGSNKENQKTPKSGGSHLCKPCNKSFGSESALDSHSKAKHSAGK